MFLGDMANISVLLFLFSGILNEISGDDNDYGEQNQMNANDNDRAADSSSSSELGNTPKKGDPIDDKLMQEIYRYQDEIKAGNIAEIFGTNPNYYNPPLYVDLGRRYVLQYPYKEINKAPNKNSEETRDYKSADSLINLANNVNNLAEEDNSLTPKWAPPEVVLAVAKESALLNAAAPINPSDEFIRKDILRTGDYWNGVWKEDIDTNNLLRARKPTKLESVRTEIMPGTDLYDIVSKLKNITPKLIYVINKNKMK